MPEMITSLSTNALSIAVYGQPNSGKSHAVTTYTKGKQLFLQTEPGICTPARDPEWLKRTTAIKLTDYRDLEMLAYGVDDWIKDWNRRTKVTGMQPIEDEFDLVSLDSATWAQRLVMEQVLKDYPSKKASRQGIPDQQNWGMISVRMLNILNGLCKSRQRIYVTVQKKAQTFTSKAGEEDSFDMFVPNLVGQQKDNITHDFDWIFWSYTKRVKGKLQLQFFVDDRPSAMYYAKIRGVDPMGEQEFNLDTIFNRLAETVTEKRTKD